MPNKRLSTCTTQQAYIGANGSPLTDVSAFAKVLDNILVMNYDVWGGKFSTFSRSLVLPTSRLTRSLSLFSFFNSWTERSSRKQLRQLDATERQHAILDRRMDESRYASFQDPHGSSSLRLHLFLLGDFTHPQTRLDPFDWTLESTLGETQEI